MPVFARTIGIDHPRRPFGDRRGLSALWSRGFAPEGRTPDQHDAFCIAAWLSRADDDGTLASFLKPDLAPAERAVAQIEGWILGVPGLIRTAGKPRGFPIRRLRSELFRLH
jgi:hypothetical protein